MATEIEALDASRAADPQKGENTNAGKLEYQFTPRWGLEAYGGDGGAFGADVMWSREY